MCGAIIDSILTGLVKELCELFKIVLCVLCSVLVGYIVCLSLLLPHYLHRSAYDATFYLVVIFYLTPALCASVFLFGCALFLIAQRPNSKGLEWHHLAYFAGIGGCAFLSFAFFLGNRSWTGVPVPVQYFVALTSLVYFPFAAWTLYEISYISRWTGVVAKVQGEELARLQTMVEERCKAYRSKYDFHVTLEQAYRISSPDLEEQFSTFCANHRDKRKTSNRKQLFHGTAASCAKSIIESGFRLPNAGGMFGKGVYFADTPLKSMQYAGGCFSRTMLLCEVELGNTMMKRMADNSLEGGEDMQRNWVMRTLFRAQSFHSVTAVDGFMGAVRVPEYVVFNPHQCVPRYLLVVKQASVPVESAESESSE
eukprot:TRINITY_DN14194_c0_g1_i1.p1 TRINITY_DN14194_c0_g1~~TRINITY_DN14194_c0_g1_i1.p1  ORF type:complete len:367 (-),score=26.43 TRINITY_DN14194_c0_g1_i1:43-1143(-)